MGSSAVEQLRSISFEDYLAAEQRSERRHEWVGGRVYAMTGGTERHALAALATLFRLRPGARAAGCRSFVADRMLRIDEVAYYPTSSSSAAGPVTPIMRVTRR